MLRWVVGWCGAVLLCAWPAAASEPARSEHPFPSDAVSRPHLEAPAVPQPPGIHLPRSAASQLLLSSRELHVDGPLRVIVFAPHPDDETLGAAGLIQRVRAAGGKVRIVFVTNGDGYVAAVRHEVQRARTSSADFIEYGERRHGEAVLALHTLGLGEHDGVFLGFPDDGIDDLWAGHWSTNRPYRSPHTRLDRPAYKESLSQRVEYDGSDLEHEISETLREFRPDWVVVPDPRDRHPDHCTTGVFVLDALRRLRQAGEGAFERAHVFTYLVHYRDYPASPMWVKEIAGAGIGGSTTAGRVLAATHWVNLPLSADELSAKRRAMAAYRSQVQVMNPFLQQFLRSFELFGRLDNAQITAVPQEYAARFRRAK